MKYKDYLMTGIKTVVANLLSIIPVALITGVTIGVVNTVISANNDTTMIINVVLYLLISLPLTGFIVNKLYGWR